MIRPAASALAELCNDDAAGVVQEVLEPAKRARMSAVEREKLVGGQLNLDMGGG
jgi:hypothetical protein